MNKHDVPKINEKASKHHVEKALFQYRDYLLTLPTHLMPKVTPSYSLVPPSNTNAFHSSTEDIAIQRIQYETERNAFLQEINEAMNTLKDNEREILVKKYFLHEVGYDVEIWNDMGFGKTKYYEIKGQAMLRLAFALKIEVYYPERSASHESGSADKRQRAVARH